MHLCLTPNLNFSPQAREQDHIQLNPCVVQACRLQHHVFKCCVGRVECAVVRYRQRGCRGKSLLISERGGRHVRRTAADGQVSRHPHCKGRNVSWRTWQLKLALLAQPKTWVVDLLRGTFRRGSATSPSTKENPSETTAYPVEEELAVVLPGKQWYVRVHLALCGRWPSNADGTPFSKLDSIFGIFVINLVTGSRHHVETLQKTGICLCGCKGWCSIFFLAQFVKWSCFAMTSGKWSTAASYDGKTVARRLRRGAVSACSNTTGVHGQSPSYHLGTEYSSTLGFPLARRTLTMLRLPL